MLEPNASSHDKPYTQFEIKEAVIFLIHLTPALMSLGSLFEILLSINDLMAELVITMPNTGFGIYIYNCKPSHVLKPTGIPGLYRLLKLRQLRIAGMKFLSDIVLDHQNGITKLESLLQTAPSYDPETLPAIFSHALEKLVSLPFFNRKRLLWFTADDKPFALKATSESLYRIVNDFYNYGYFIRPILLGDADKPFDMTQFREIFISTNFLAPTSTQKHGFSGFRKDSAIFTKPLLATEIRQQIFRIKEVRRTRFTCNLVLSDGKGVGGKVGCTIKGFTLFNPVEVRPDALMYFVGEIPRRVFTEAKPVSQEGNVPVTVPAERIGLPLNGDEVLIFNDEQLEFMSQCVFDHEAHALGDNDDDDLEDDIAAEEVGQAVPYSERPFLKLLGFRDLSKFLDAYHMGKATFVTADLSDGARSTALPGGYTNSFTTFASLYSSCVRLRKYAVLFGSTLRSYDPALYALYPTRTKNSTKIIDAASNSAAQEMPQGFLLFRLPWLDNIRNLPSYFIQDSLNQYKTQPDVFRKLLLKYKCLLRHFFMPEYTPQDFPNPSLNYFYKVLKHEHLQLDLPLEETLLERNDTTQMRLVYLRKQMLLYPENVALVVEINEALLEQEQEAEKAMATAEKAGTVRKASAPDPSSGLKKPRLGSVRLTDEIVVEAWKSNEWRHINLKPLQEYQKRHAEEIRPASKKPDLIANVVEYISSRYSKV